MSFLNNTLKFYSYKYKKLVKMDFTKNNDKKNVEIL